MLDALATPIIAGAATLAAAGSCAYYATYAVRSQWLGETDWHGRRDTSAASLTFDDGPSEDTERVLDVLDRLEVRAAFFMVGRNVERLPRVARRVAERGHEIGNHSYSHPIYLYRSGRDTRRQLERAQAVIESATGVRPRLARPPCGVRTPAYFAAARELGLRTVQWDVAGFDWTRRRAQEIAREVLRGARAGSIILLHDGDSDGKRDRRETFGALPFIVAGLKERGLRVAPLSDLLAERSREGERTIDDRAA
ncbi:MAG: peptidoglycan-N-acetylglucosamine deacetylase [Acidobacteriota bacterium]|jgi:peptidoglycan/xylan/chitin deacetylase (PgdA/CDA1 family)|nr:peptidoglycan-N-acetylglucosamine deacetylase [Acidobacteriota bacterium]MDT7779700.1 peptidoglycan-N-acetylglucosamine deacetylase [Acidobacteriota bacterium]